MVRSWLVGILAGYLAFSLLGCDCSGGPADNNYEDCVDKDGDGYGQGCMLGPDCNDSDPALNFSCDCAVVPHQGCACSAIQAEDCFEADLKFKSVGLCVGGKRQCVGGKYSACLGQVLPQGELCDGFDQDCDGQTDEGLECNDCGPRCFTQKVGPDTPTEFELDPNSDRGLQLDPAGNLTLKEGGEQIELSFLWVANSDEGTVSKINTRTGKEEGRYISALTSASPRNRGHAPSQRQNAPSRTAVDFNGDVWVANRAFDQQGTVTKIAHTECLDFDGSGKVETSSDVSGNGTIELTDPREFLGERDECILFTVDVGGNKGIPRALALDSGTADGGQGNAWVGVYTERKFYKLAAADGRVLAEVSVPLQPYGAAIDSQGILWTGGAGTGTIASIDTNDPNNPTPGPLIDLGTRCEGSYGIAVDANGRVWVGAYPCEGAFRYDPADGSVMVVDTPGKGVGRGIAADGKGFIWVAHSWAKGNGDALCGRVTRFKADDGSEMQTFEFPNALETIGVGIDFDGRAWGVNRKTNNACRVDPDTGEIACFPTGEGTYTYSDFTGFALRNFTAPSGTYRQVFQGCGSANGTRWSKLTWDAAVPDGTAVKFFVRAADTREGLATAQRFGPFTTSPADLLKAGEIVGSFLQVEVELSSEVKNRTPILKGIGVQWICAGET